MAHSGSTQVAGILAAVEHQSASEATARANSRMASARDAGMPMARSAATSSSAVGKVYVEAVDLEWQRMSEPGGEPRGERGSAGHAHLLAENRADAQFEAVPGAGNAQTGRACIKRASSGSRLRLELMASGSASRSNMRRTRATTCSKPRRPDEIDAQRQSVRGMRLHLQPAGLRRPARSFCDRRRRGRYSTPAMARLARNSSSAS